MTESTQAELDEILEDFYDGDIRQSDMGKAKYAILDWHNKQTEELLDRLESKGLNEDGGSRYSNTPDGYVSATAWNEAQDRVKRVIRAERDRLNPSKSTPFNKLKEMIHD